MKLRPDRTTVRVGFVVAALVVALTVADLTSDGFRRFSGDHSLVSTFMAEAVLLVGVYLVIDEIMRRRETRRWRDVASLGMRVLSEHAHRPAQIVRRVVDELLETERVIAGHETAAPGGVNYEAVVDVRADELGDWLRADAARASSFAEETRQRASLLEEAIGRWGPTLVEDPDGAELINLLPDIVDSSRAAAEAISPTPGVLARMRGKEATASLAPPWTESARLRFKRSLLEILRNPDEFDRGRPPEHGP